MSLDFIPSILSTKTHHLNFNNGSFKASSSQQVRHYGIYNNEYRCKQLHTKPNANVQKQQM